MTENKQMKIDNAIYILECLKGFEMGLFVVKAKKHNHSRPRAAEALADSRRPEPLASDEAQAMVSIFDDEFIVVAFCFRKLAHKADQILWQFRRYMVSSTEHADLMM